MCYCLLLWLHVYCCWLKPIMVILLIRYDTIAMHIVHSLFTTYNRGILFGVWCGMLVSSRLVSNIQYSRSSRRIETVYDSWKLNHMPWLIVSYTAWKRGDVGRTLVTSAAGGGIEFLSMDLIIYWYIFNNETAIPDQTVIIISSKRMLYKLIKQPT